MMWHDDSPRQMRPVEVEAMTRQCIRVTYPDDVTPQAKRATATCEALQCSR